MKLIYILILTQILTQACSQSIPITFTLEPFINQTQPITNKQVALRPLEAYHHDSDYLQYNNKHFNECRNYRGAIQQQIIAFLPIPGKLESVNQQLYVQKHGVLFLLQSSFIHVIRFSETDIKTKYIEKLKFKKDQVCQTQMILSSDSDLVYIFDCVQIWKIQLKHSITEILLAEKIIKFNGFKVLNGGEGFYIWVSSNNGLVIFQQTQKLKRKQLLWISNEQIRDSCLVQNRLYLLGIDKTVYILERLGDGNYRSTVNISLENLCSQCKNEKIIVSENMIYIYSIEDREQFISELQFSENFLKVFFVRYYKGHRNMISMEIWNGKLLTVSNQGINLYETNMDPRTIETQDNGVSNHHMESEVLLLKRITSTLFLKITQIGSTVIKLIIKKPYILCQFEESTNHSIEIKRHCSQAKETNKMYWQSCLTKDIIHFKVEEPPKQIHIFALVSVFLFSLTVVIMLVMWRKSKIDVIQALVFEINKLKINKNLKNVEFVQEKQVSREVDWREQQGSIEQHQHPESKQQELNNIESDRQMDS